MLVTYVGRHDAVEVDLPSGGVRTFRKGEAEEVSDDLGRSLLEQPSNWSPRVPKRADKAATAAKEGEA